MKIALLILLLITIVSGAAMQERLLLRLQQDVSSKMANGSPFSAVDADGSVYTGYLATKKGKWFHGLWNRGTIRLVFDESLEVVSVGGRDVKENGEVSALARSSKP